MQPRRRAGAGQAPATPAGCSPASSKSRARPPQPCIEEQDSKSTVCAMGEWEKRDKVGERVSAVWGDVRDKKAGDQLGGRNLAGKKAAVVCSARSAAPVCCL